MISLIIPTYNRQASTDKAIESVISQGIEVELIIIDDASDKAFCLASEHQNKSNITVVRKNSNCGPAAARNTGIEIASQPLISFLDSDDYLLPNTLERRINFALQQGILNKEGERKIIGCSWQETNDHNKIIATRHPRSSKSPEDLFAGCWFCPGSAIIANRKLFDQISNKYDEDLKRLEDLDLFMRLSQIGANYEAQHLVGVSITASDSRYPDVVIKACNDIHEKYLVEGMELNQKLQASLKSYLFYELSRAHISKHEYHRALDYLVKSFIQKPRLSLYPGPGWSSTPDHF